MEITITGNTVAELKTQMEVVNRLLTFHVAPLPEKTPAKKPVIKKLVKKAKAKVAIIKMAHSRGDVMLHESSYIAAVFSPKRRVALEFIDEFVEDFKASAPIWKYDLRDGERIYALDRSTAIKGSGILGVKK